MRYLQSNGSLFRQFSSIKPNAKQLKTRGLPSVLLNKVHKNVPDS